MKTMWDTLTLTVIVLSCFAAVGGRSSGNQKKAGKHDEHSAYFAAFDPQLNQTKTFSVPEFFRSHRIPNFIVHDSLVDREEETRVHYNNLTAKETKVLGEIDTETGKRSGIILRQLTDGVHFIQMIYNADLQIQDCEFIKEQQHVEQFLTTFKADVQKAQNLDDPFGDDDFEEDEGDIVNYLPDDLNEMRNVSFEVLEKKLPDDLVEWMNFDKLKTECKKNHKMMKRMLHFRQHGNDEEKQMANKHFERTKRSLTMIAPGTKWCGRSHIADTYTSVGGFSRTDKCCRTHDHCQVNIPSFTTKYDYFNIRPMTISHCRCDRRRKRDLMDIMRVPGTEWCGKGGRAPRYTSLGGFSRADRCCRAHDTSCPFWIGAFQEKYGMFNWRINTIMHCRCDKRFRACLKMARTGAANLVGKLFFNVVQTQCFVLKPEKVCTKLAWWGTCIKYQFKKRAHLKKNLYY